MPSQAGFVLGIVLFRCQAVTARRPGTPMWEHNGIVCHINILNERVRLTLHEGVSLSDPQGLFNASLEGNTRRTIDFYEGDQLAWVNNVFERIDVDSRDERVVAVWRATTDEDANRSDSVTEWLRRAGAGQLLRSRGETASEISLPRPARSREWLNVALLDCGSCHQVVERRSPVQRYCADCADALARKRSSGAVRRRRDSTRGR